MVVKMPYWAREGSAKKKEQCFLVPALFWAFKNLKARINKLVCFKACEPTLR